MTAEQSIFIIAGLILITYFRLAQQIRLKGKSQLPASSPVLLKIRLESSESDAGLPLQERRFQKQVLLPIQPSTGLYLPDECTLRNLRIDTVSVSGGLIIAELEVIQVPSNALPKYVEDFEMCGWRPSY